MSEIERLMSVHEGVCPDCGSDLLMVEVAGTYKFFEGIMAIFDRSEWVDKIVSGNVADAKEVGRLLAGKCVAIAENADDNVFLDFPRHVAGTLWEDRDGYSDKGVEVFKCFKVGCHTTPYLGRVFETYMGCGGDWTLAEGTFDYRARQSCQE
jgi:hypothetical protein